MIASMPFSNPPAYSQLKGVPEDVAAKLEPEEVKLLAAYLAEIRTAKERDELVRSVAIIDWSIDNAAKAIDKLGSIDATQAGKIWEAMETLGKALKKLGYPHSAFKGAAQPKAPAALTGQRDLLDATAVQISESAIVWPDSGVLTIDEQQDEAGITKGAYAFPNKHAGTFVWCGTRESLNSAVQRFPGAGGWIRFNNAHLGGHWLPENGASAD
jgi:hypothetical protein